MKRTVAFIVALTIMLSGICLAWENVTPITLYSGPGYEYSTELGTLQKDWYVEVISLALDRKDNYWAHIKFANYSDRFYMAYTPLSTINIDGSSVVGLDVEGQGIEYMQASYDVDVYYGPHNPNVWENQYAKCPNRLKAGAGVELIKADDNYSLVDYIGNDNMKHRGYVKTNALEFTKRLSDYDSVPDSGYWGNSSGNSNGSSYGYSYGSGTRASYINGIYQEYVYESSHLKNQWGDYRVERAFDNNANTDWVEGSNGKQLNDYVGCVWRTNDSRLAACGIVIKGGMQYLGYTSWNRNQRPRNITVTINGNTYYFTMSDSMSEQTFYFGGDAIRPDSGGRLDLCIFRTEKATCTDI